LHLSAKGSEVLTVEFRELGHFLNLCFVSLDKIDISKSTANVNWPCALFHFFRNFFSPSGCQ
jgi:hypothetical protein